MTRYRFRYTFNDCPSLLAEIDGILGDRDIDEADRFRIMEEFEQWISGKCREDNKDAGWFCWFWDAFVADALENCRTLAIKERRNDN